jgi:hypothetical protein
MQAESRTVRVVSGLQRDFTFVLTTLPVTTWMVDGTRINVYAVATEVEGSVQTGVSASRALRLFNAQFGQYPYNELDFVAVVVYRLIRRGAPRLIRPRLLLVIPLCRI